MNNLSGVSLQQVCGSWTTYDAANCQEPYNDCQYFTQSTGIFSLHAIDSNRFEEFEADIQVEYCRYTDRSEETHENGLSFLLDLVNKLVHGEDDRETSIEDQYSMKSWQI